MRAPVALAIRVEGEDLVGDLAAAPGQDLDLGAVQDIGDDDEAVPAKELGGVGRIARRQDLEPTDAVVGLEIGALGVQV